MKLEEIADIKQGIPLSRIKLTDGMDTEDRIVYSFEEESTVKVPKNISEVDQNIPLVQKGMILFNLMSYNAKKASEEDIGKIIPSSYVKIVLKDKSIDVDYLAWYMDQSEQFKRELFKIIQGTTVLSLPINEFRQMKIKIPDLAFQKKLGSISRLSKKRQKLYFEREELLCKALVTINEEELLNG